MGYSEPVSEEKDLKNPKKSVEGVAMDELGLHRYCCCRMFLGNVHLITYI